MKQQQADEDARGSDHASCRGRKSDLKPRLRRPHASEKLLQQEGLSQSRCVCDLRRMFSFARPRRIIHRRNERRLCGNRAPVYCSENSHVHTDPFTGRALRSRSNVIKQAVDIPERRLHSDGTDVEFWTDVHLKPSRLLLWLFFGRFINEIIDEKENSN
ncbi:hypothetical protein ROHU_022697 [Labeo rohita]|uniref:Uncharacterized protein n=1 Tax=Labeo rohita TaxID=84645 RepID=A0A498MQ79_LABRO|nr:hypothetical protein ROHU_022697 [Labeo rohita]